MIKNHNYKRWQVNEVIFILKYKNIVLAKDLGELFQVSDNSIYSTINRYGKYYNDIIKYNTLDFKYLHIQKNIKVKSNKSKYIININIQ